MPKKNEIRINDSLSIFSYKTEKEFVNKLIREVYNFDKKLYFPLLTENDIYDIVLDLYLIINKIIEEESKFKYYGQLWFFNEIDFIKKFNLNIKDYFRESLLQNRGFFGLIYFIEVDQYSNYPNIDDLDNCSILLNYNEMYYIDKKTFIK